MKIAIAGIGYVGLSMAVLLAQYNEVIAVDVINEKVELINSKLSPIRDPELEEYLLNKKLNLIATTDAHSAYKNAELIIISTPTNYDTEKNHFDTTSIEEVINVIIEVNPDAVIVIKSTIPVGYTEELNIKYNKANIIFSPEFLREGHALYDNLYPSRIIVGVSPSKSHLQEKAQQFAHLLEKCALGKNIPMLYMRSTEAEAVKLFSNTYLALRVAYFNELDTYAELKGLNTENIINGMCLDPRIGDYYNNPSFGYGGYCLPKDTKQLLANYKNIPEDIISAVVKSNSTRKKFIAEQIIQKNCIINHQNGIIGIYRLTMKSKSDNFRESSIKTIIKQLKIKNMQLIIYEPQLEGNSFMECRLVNCLDEFKKKSNVIVANRMCDELWDVKDRVYTRDLYIRD